MLVVVTMGIVFSQMGTAPAPVSLQRRLPHRRPARRPPRRRVASAPPSPAPTSLGTLSARSLSLGTDAAPIDVTEAFGSIWVANIHANEVRRYDPATMAELARIDVSGAAWFAVAEDALWVTRQNDTGLSRIDPASNEVVAVVGAVPPCGAPVVAFDSLWQSACDAGVILRIDPATNEVQDEIPSDGHLFLTFAGDRLIALAPDGLASLDPESGTFTPLPNPDVAGAEILASDGDTVWVPTPTSLLRVDPASGRDHRDAGLPGCPGDHVRERQCVADVPGEGVVEIDLATNQPRRTIPVPGDPARALRFRRHALGHGLQQQPPVAGGPVSRAARRGLPCAVEILTAVASWRVAVGGAPRIGRRVAPRRVRRWRGTTRQRLPNEVASASS